MLAKRIIAKLDIKSENVVKGVHMEGLKIVGNPKDLSQKYNAQKADELIYIDTVASLYGRNHLVDIIREVTEECHIPVTVGGGIRSLEAMRTLISGGADKVAINTYAHENPSFLSEASKEFGAQAIVLSVHAKKIGSEYMCFSENGREFTGRKVLDWVVEAESLGVGEILLMSIDRDGTGKGFDLDLVNTVCEAVNIPVVAAGGCRNSNDVIDVLENSKLSGFSMASALHFDWLNIPDLRNHLKNNGISVREVNS